MPPTSFRHANPVSFTDAVRWGFSGSFKWNGRATRSEYWLWFLFTLAVSMVFQMLSSMLNVLVSLPAPTSQEMLPSQVIVLVGFSALSMLASLALAVPSLALAIRRVHDVGRSAWWVTGAYLPAAAMAVVSFFAIVALLASTTSHSDTLPAWFPLFFIILVVLFLITLALAVVLLIFLVQPSTPKPTKWDAGFRPAGQLVPYAAPAPVAVPEPNLPARLSDGSLMFNAYSTTPVSLRPGEPGYAEWDAYLRAMGR